MENIEPEKDKAQYMPSGDETRVAPKTYLKDNEGKSSTASPVPARSEQKPQGEKHAATSSTTPKAETDDSVLGFNFLYYIIQRYKMSDIVDQ